MDSQEEAHWANQPDRQPSRSPSTLLDPIDSPELPAETHPCDLDPAETHDSATADLGPPSQIYDAATLPADLGLPSQVDLGGHADLGLPSQIYDAAAIPADLGLPSQVDLGGHADLGLPSQIYDAAAIPADLGLPSQVDLGGHADLGLPSQVDLGVHAECHDAAAVEETSAYPLSEDAEEEWPELDAAMMMAALGEAEDDLPQEDPYCLIDGVESPVRVEPPEDHPEDDKDDKIIGETSADEWETMSRGSSIQAEQKRFDSCLARVQKMDEPEFKKHLNMMLKHECWPLFSKHQVKPNTASIPDEEHLLAFWETHKDRYTSIEQVRADAVAHLARKEEMNRKMATAAKPEDEPEDFIPLRHAEQNQLRAKKREDNKEKMKKKNKGTKSKGANSTSEPSAHDASAASSAPAEAEEAVPADARSTEGHAASPPRGTKRKSEQLIDPKNKEFCKKKLWFVYIASVCCMLLFFV